jgi:hypothetical protein
VAGAGLLVFDHAFCVARPLPQVDPSRPEGIARSALVEIQIVYQTWEGAEPIRLLVSPEDYFDPLAPGETYEADGIPRYNHTWEYLPVPRHELKWSVERRRGTWFDTTFFTQYLEGGRTWMNHRIDPDGYEEMIHHTQLSEDRCQIMRTCRTPNGVWAVSLNSVIVDLADGSQEERRYDLPWSPEEVARYAQSHPCRHLISG